jgi:hypothetical protein
MKPLFFPFLLICLSFLFSSCQKEVSLAGTTTDTTGGGGTGGGGTPGGSGYYIKAKKDGVQKTYTSFASANIIDLTSGVMSLALVAGTPNSLEGFNIAINFFNTPIKVGTYSEDYPGFEYILGGVYNPNSTSIVYGAGLQTPSIKPLVVKILTKTTTEMTGTFEGAFYKQDINAGSVSTEYFLFTEGAFKLPIK